MLILIFVVIVALSLTIGLASGVITIALDDLRKSNYEAFSMAERFMQSVIKSQRKQGWHVKFHPDSYTEIITLGKLMEGSN